MASIPSPVSMDVPYLDHNIECPFCCSRVSVVAAVETKQADIRHTGSAGFNKPQFSVRLEPKIIGIKISHECKGPKEK